MPDLGGVPLSPTGNTGDITMPGGTTPTAPTVPPSLSEGFGYGGFGADDWNYHVMWRVLTTGDMKSRDENDPKRAFRRWRHAQGIVLDRRRKKARDFWHLISAQHCPSNLDEPATVVPVSKTATADGVVTMAVDGFSQAKPINGIQPGWLWTCPDGSTFEVKAIRKGYDPDAYRAEDGLIYGLLYEFDLAAPAAGDVALGEAVVYRPDVLRRLARHMGVSVPAGIKDELRRGIVQRGRSTFALKGTQDGFSEHARQSGFSIVVDPLSAITAEIKAMHDPADLVVGAVPWEGFVPFLGDGTANAIDSKADQSTMTVHPDLAPSYGLSRKVGESVEGKVEAGSVSIVYTIQVGATTKVFKATDDGAGNIVPASSSWKDTHGVPFIGKIVYATGDLALTGADQDDYLEHKIYPFAKDVRVEVDFKQERDYSIHRPAIARMDQVIADAQQLDVYKWEDPTEYEHTITTEAMAGAIKTPYTPTSEHKVKVTWAAGVRPMALDANKVPRGSWRIEKGSDSWWIERVDVDSDDGKDLLVVVGTDLPPTDATKVVYDPPVVTTVEFTPVAAVKVALTALTPSWYSDPAGDEDDRYLARIAEVLPAHVIVAKTE